MSTWVSHTPDTTRSKDDVDIDEEDFASAAELTTNTNNNNINNNYAPPSPPNAFEKFFLNIEATNGEETSPFALAASRINNTTAITNTNTNTTTSRKFLSSRSSIASESLLTADFASATDDFSETSLDDISLDESNTNQPKGNNSTTSTSSLFNDILGKQTILEEIETETLEEEHSEMAKKHRKRTMASKQKTETTYAAAVAAPAPTPTPVVEEPEPIKVDTPTPVPAPTPEHVESETVESEPTPTEETKPHFDVVENVYEGAKSVWSFGKGIIIFKPFMGVAEDAATKMLSITTGVSSLEDADKHIKSTLSGVDVEFIDPAILKLWSVLEPIVGKGDEVLKSILSIGSKKIPMIKGKEEQKEETTAPEEEIVKLSTIESKKESEEATSPETSTPAVIA
jgi:hypothetical protein